jgi:hypothetical protein
MVERFVKRHDAAGGHQCRELRTFEFSAQRTERARVFLLLDRRSRCTDTLAEVDFWSAPASYVPSQCNRVVENFLESGRS